MKKKLVYISNIAAPHQVKLCYGLQQFFDAEFWFYDSLGSRDKWWKIDLGDKCKIIPNVKFKSSSKFYTTKHIDWLNKCQPDIVMLGGFSIPANYMAYRWAKKNNKKTIVFTERSRNKKGQLRKRGLVWRILQYLYKDIDMVMVSEKDIVPQFKDEFQFGDKVVAARYASDIDSYLSHEFRKPKENYVYMFPNRLTELYNPLGALDIFLDVHKKYSGSTLIMNAVGEQRTECENFIKTHQLNNAVEFLDNIKSWDKLHEEYRRCDIMIFPATFSNGNFTIIEGMASGMGLIISDKILGVGTYIKNGINGFRVAPEKALFKEKIEDFINQPELFEKFAYLNRDRVKSLGVSATAELYHELIQKYIYHQVVTENILL